MSSSIVIKNKKEKTLYNYIKITNKDLYNIIKRAGAKDIFIRSNLTFLLPNEILLNKLKDVNIKQAMTMLRELLFIKTIKNLYDFNGKIENLNGKFLKNPSRLNLKIDLNFEKIIGYDTCALYLYNSSNLPETIEINNENNKINQKIEIDYKIKKHEQLIKKYKKYIKEGKKGINPFVIEIANILKKIKNTPLYKDVCELMDNNAIITWFIIIQLGLNNNPILPNELFKLKTIDHPNPQDEYNKAFENVETMYNGKNWFKIASSIREKLLTRYIDRSTLPEQIIKAYKENYMKLLQDEIRYRYYNINDIYWYDSIKELENIDWNNPKDQLILSNEDIYNQIIDPDIEFYSGPIGFVKSLYFMYKPLTKKNLEIVLKNNENIKINSKEDGIIFGDIGDRNNNVNNDKKNEYDINSIIDGLNNSDINQLCNILIKTKKININTIWNNLNENEKEEFKSELLNIST